MLRRKTLYVTGGPYSRFVCEGVTLFAVRPGSLLAVRENQVPQGPHESSPVRSAAVSVRYRTKDQVPEGRSRRARFRYSPGQIPNVF
jgi:hypothetical protein